MIWIVLFLGLNLTSARIVLISADSDPGLHRRLGEWMLQHHAVVREDFLLHTHHGPTIEKEWLSAVLFAAAGRWFGWGGFVLLAATLIATCFWLLYRQLLAEGCDPVLATGLLLVAMLACSMHWLARPLLFTHLLALVFAWQLRWFQLGRISARQLFLILPPLMILWANLHGAFMTGLVLIAMYALGGAIDSWHQTAHRDRPRTLATLLLACGAASLVNPYGLALPARVVGFMRSRELSTVTTEFASPNFHTVGTHGFLLLLLLLAATLMIIRPRLRTTDVLLIGGWGFLALFSARNIPIFALVVTPLLAQWLTESMHANPNSWWIPWYRKSTSRVSVSVQTVDSATVIAVVVCLLLVLAKPRIAGGEPVLATDFPPTRYPTAAVDFLRAHPDAVRGEMFNYFLWGGYLEFALPDRRPFIDSRNDSYGVGLVRDFRIANEPNPGWDAVFARYNVGWTILPVQHPLNRILELSPHWTRVFSNQTALVYSRTP